MACNNYDTQIALVEHVYLPAPFNIYNSVPESIVQVYDVGRSEINFTVSFYYYYYINMELCN